nr:hypothetical protein [uncultured Pseudomonas sp.]
MTHFNHTFTCLEYRFWLGRETRSARRYQAIARAFDRTALAPGTASWRRGSANVGAGLPRETGSAEHGTAFAGGRGASPLPQGLRQLLEIEQGSCIHK